MDPYVKYFIGTQTDETKPDYKSGCYPKWNKILQFNINGEKNGYATLRDKDWFDAEYIGRFEINVEELCKLGTGTVKGKVIKGPKHQGKKFEEGSFEGYVKYEFTFTEDI